MHLMILFIHYPAKVSTAPSNIGFYATVAVLELLELVAVAGYFRGVLCCIGTRT